MSEAPSGAYAEGSSGGGENAEQSNDGESTERSNSESAERPSGGESAERSNAPGTSTHKRRGRDTNARASMEKALWYLLAGTRGGENRARIIRLVDERPRNANRLAEELDVDYNTVRHHLDVLLDHDVVERGGDDYGAMYFLTDRFEHHRDVFETITEQMD